MIEGDEVLVGALEPDKHIGPFLAVQPDRPFDGGGAGGSIALDGQFFYSGELSGGLGELLELAVFCAMVIDGDDCVGGEAHVGVEHEADLAACGDGADDKDAGDDELDDDESFSDEPVLVFRVFLQNGDRLIGGEDAGGIEAGQQGGEDDDGKSKEDILGCQGMELDAFEQV